MKTKQKKTVKCLLCKGKGTYKKDGKQVKCSVCSGKGELKLLTKSELVIKLRRAGCTYSIIQKLMKFKSDSSVHYYLKRQFEIEI